MRIICFGFGLGHSWVAVGFGPAVSWWRGGRGVQVLTVVGAVRRGFECSGQVSHRRATALCHFVIKCTNFVSTKSEAAVLESRTPFVLLPAFESWIMPKSPIKRRVYPGYLTQDEARMREHLARNLAKRDDDDDDPDHVRREPSIVVNGETFIITRVVGNTLKCRWQNVSCNSRSRLEECMTAFKNAKTAGGFTMDADVNPVRREARERAYYQNQAMLAHARLLAQAFIPGFNIDRMIARGLICDLNVF